MVYESGTAAAGIKTNITRVEEKSMDFVFIATPLGEEIAVQIDNPVEARYASEALDIPFDTVYLAQKTDSCNLIEESSNYSPLSSPTSPRNTNNPFN